MRAVEIDRASKEVGLASGTRIPYDSLVLAVGAQVRTLPVKNAMYLRTLDDSIAIQERLEQAQDVVVIGGGFIGLEVAAVARGFGKPVTVVELQDRLMPRVVAPVISEFYRELHAEHGVEISLNHRGEARAGDLVIVGIGVIPNVDLARDAGLAVSDGVVVDEHLQTADPSIYAIGDCASHPNVFAGGLTRIESVQNAVDQARRVAADIVGRREPYRAVPWFWTDQFDIKLQMVGLSTGFDRFVTRGNPADRKFSVFYFKQERLIAIDSINRPGDHMMGRKMLAAGTSLTVEQAADESVDLKKL
jgi:3-phenylpropionate/trans-cinnamate dioxygenase ferredoxin reductase subunit